MELYVNPLSGCLTQSFHGHFFSSQPVKESKDIYLSPFGIYIFLSYTHIYLIIP